LVMSPTSTPNSQKGILNMKTNTKNFKRDFLAGVLLIVIFSLP